MISGFPVPSDKSVVATLVPNQVNIDMLMWQAFLTGTQYFNEVVAGVSYGANDSVGSIFAGSNLLNITSANLESNISAYTQGLQTLIANKNLLVASGTANTITLSTRVIDDSLESGTYAKKAPFPLNFRNGLELDFVAIADNTGAVTISIPSFQGVNGALNLVKQDFSALTSGDIKAGYRYTIICDSTNNRFILKDTFVRQATETLGGIAKISTTAQVNTGTNDLTYITPLKLKQYITSITGNSKTINGWTYLSNGLILQWGRTSYNGSAGWVTVVFPITFPNACFTVNSTYDRASQAADYRGVYNMSTTSVQIPVDSSWTYWFAIGY